MSHTFDDYIDENGHIVIAEGKTLVRHVEVNVAENADTLAYRYMDYSRERDGEAHELTWSEFGTRLRAVAARLQQVTKPGDRVAILAPQGLDYVIAFFGAIYAGTIAVPLFDPDEPGHSDRLHAVLGDCKPTAILTATNSAAGVRTFFRVLPAAERPRVIAVDAIPDSVGETWTEHDAKLDDIAYLQEHGRAYRGVVLPSGIKRRPEGTCFETASDLEDLGEGRPVRGFALRPRSSKPLAHAWITANGRDAVDAVWTWTQD